MRFQCLLWLLVLSKGTDADGLLFVASTAPLPSRPLFLTRARLGVGHLSPRPPRPHLAVATFPAARFSARTLHARRGFDAASGMVTNGAGGGALVCCRVWPEDIDAVFALDQMSYGDKVCSAEPARQESGIRGGVGGYVGQSVHACACMHVCAHHV